MCSCCITVLNIVSFTELLLTIFFTIQFSCFQILYLIVKQFAAHKAKEQERAEAQKSKGHLMISYQWSNQPMLLKVCQYLRKNGFKVWMDVDDMAGSTLEAMARAVEEAEVILVCYSRKYKDSDNCRAGM